MYLCMLACRVRQKREVSQPHERLSHARGLWHEVHVWAPGEARNLLLGSSEIMSAEEELPDNAGSGEDRNEATQQGASESMATPGG